MNRYRDRRTRDDKKSPILHLSHRMYSHRIIDTESVSLPDSIGQSSNKVVFYRCNLSVITVIDTEAESLRGIHHAAWRMTTQSYPLVIARLDRAIQQLPCLFIAVIFPLSLKSTAKLSHCA
jgi:hypothetical protein